MGIINITGGGGLFGEVRVGGSKNAVLPIILASLITRGVSLLENVPDIEDVRDCISIIESFGAKIKRGETSLEIDTTKLYYRTPPLDAVCRIRASTYLIGACLSRFGVAQLMPFGGCNFAERPIDLHLQLAEMFGAIRVKDTLVSSGLRPACAVMSKISVGATVNALLLSAGAAGESKITPYAKEPHVFSLIEYLRSAGADIEVNENSLTVRGSSLCGGYSCVVGDMVEAGTYLAAGMISGGDVTVSGVVPAHLSSFLDPLSACGVKITSSRDSVGAVGLPTCEIDITTGPYPAFPTDLQPIFAPMLASGSGGIIRDTVWRERFGYLGTLSAFGVEYERYDGAAKIKKSVFTPAHVAAPDLRGGAACILAALAARGVSTVADSQIIYRGYERITQKLSALGAKIYDA